MKLQFNPGTALVGAVASLLFGFLVFNTPFWGVVGITLFVSIMCGLIKWK